MRPRVKANELKPCDVLLMHGNSFIAKAIRLFDGTKYNHAAIFDGDKVVEAVGTGVETHGLEAAVADAECVGVFRLRKNGKSLGDAGLPYRPVKKAIAKFQGDKDRYAYEEILLLAALAATRKLPIPMLRWILDHAASVVAKITSAGREPMICSELVYRCFLGAGHAYVPRILGAGVFNQGLSMMAAVEAHRLGGGALDEVEVAKLQAEFLELYCTAKNQGDTGREIRSTDLNTPNPNFVTPGDLYKSPDLQFAGYLHL